MYDSPDVTSAQKKATSQVNSTWAGVQAPYSAHAAGLSAAAVSAGRAAGGLPDSGAAPALPEGDGAAARVM